MTNSAPRAVAAVVLAGLLTSCGTATETEPAATEPPTTTITTTTEPSDATFTLAELVDDPCQVLSDAEAEELGSAFDPVVDGTTEKYCLWFAQGGGVSFTPYPSVDHTADPANRQKMTPTVVGGHQALAGVYIKNRGCLMYVSFGGGSFKVSESRDSRVRPAPTDCPLSPEFAEAIMANLR